MINNPYPDGITVAVTGLHRGDSPQPGAAVLASLRRRFPGLRGIGLLYDPMESSLFSHGQDRLDAAYLVPYPRTGADELLKRLHAIFERERIDCIIPCLDSELPNFIALQAELTRKGVRCMLPSALSFERRDKSRLFGLCQRLEIPAPITRSARDAATLERLAAKIGYPLYVKGKYYEAHLANTAAELHVAAEELLRVWGPPVLVQQPIYGEEYDVVGLGDGKGAVIGSCTIRKMLRTSAGKGFAGVVVADSRIDELVRRIVSSLRWKGPFELEFVKATGKPHALFEMNPRFPAWVDFPSQLACNLPVRLLENMLDLATTPLCDCKPGQMFIRHSIDLAGDIADLAQIASAGERANEVSTLGFEALP